MNHTVSKATFRCCGDHESAPGQGTDSEPEWCLSRHSGRVSAEVKAAVCRRSGEIAKAVADVITDCLTDTAMNYEAATWKETS
jgi:hypothetical protein